MRERFYPNGGQMLKFEDVKAEICYREEEEEDGRVVVIAYSGRKKKYDFYERHENMESMEKRVEEFVHNLRRYKERKAEERKARAEAKKEALKKLKSEVQVGTYLRASFSYTMTFNYFYKVVEIKGNKVVLEELNKKWVSGDIGWTGDVSCDPTPTGKLVEGKFTQNGLKVENSYPRPCLLEDTFYENHLD